MTTDSPLMSKRPAPALHRTPPVDAARLFDGARDAVAVFHPDLAVAYANPAFRVLIPVREGQPLRDVLGPPAELYEAPVLGVVRDGRAATALHRIAAAGGERTLVGNYAPIRDSEDKVTAVLLIAHDLPGFADPGEPSAATDRRRPAPTGPEDGACGLALLDGGLRLVVGNDALRELTHAPESAFRPGAPLGLLLAALVGGAAGDSRAQTLQRHLLRRGGRPFDLQSADRRRLQISLHRPESGETVLRVCDVSRARLTQAHVEHQAALLRLLAEAQSSFLPGSPFPRAFSRFLDGLLRIAHCHAGMIAGWREETAVPLASAGTWSEASERPLPPVAAQAVASGTAARADDSGTSGLGHTLALPVVARGRTLGLVVLSDRAAPFDDPLVADLTQTLPALAAMISVHAAEPRRRQTTRDLRSSQERTRAIFDAILEGVVTIDAAGAIVGFNASAEQMFGYSLRDVLGRHLRSLFPEGAPLPFDLRSPCDGTVPPAARRHEISARRADGRSFPAEASISRVIIDGEPLFVAIFQDISERKRIDRLKSELVTTVGHDLRTPLTSILGALSLASTGNLPPERTKDLLDVAERNGRRLLRLITNLLDLERINAGMISFEPRPIDLGLVLRQSIDNHRLLAEAKNLAVVWDLPDRPLRVVGDADRLAQVAVNIFGNAVRFSPEGGSIVIRARLENGIVRVEFSDRGPGIPPSFLPVMFDRFRQLESRVRGTAGASTEGSGLGLSIVRALIELHGGRVGAVSPEGGGATVFFELPGDASPNS
jgi:PAS domain S-box-containing protein